MENYVPAKKLLATWNRDGDYKMKVRKASMPRLLIILEDISQIMRFIIREYKRIGEEESHYTRSFYFAT